MVCIYEFLKKDDQQATKKGDAIKQKIQSFCLRGRGYPSSFCWSFYFYSINGKGDSGTPPDTGANVEQNFSGNTYEFFDVILLK
jgi:hypothetical protein